MARMIADLEMEWVSSAVCRGCEGLYRVDQDDVERFEGVADRYHATCPGCGVWHDIDKATLPYWVRRKADDAFAKIDRRRG